MKTLTDTKGRQLTISFIEYGKFFQNQIICQFGLAVTERHSTGMSWYSRPLEDYLICMN